MHSAALLAKDSTGRIVPFQNNEKVRFIDGSFTADIPRKRLSELFHVTQDIVSQVNPHVVAWLDQHAEVAAQFNVFRRLESYFSSDVLHRLQGLAKLRLLPAMFGSDLKSMAFRQRYRGDVTVLPRLGGPHCLVRMVQNPTREMMRFYISEGQLAAFKVLSHITHCLAIEKQLGASLAHVIALGAEVTPSPGGVGGGSPKITRSPSTLRRSYDAAQYYDDAPSKDADADGGGTAAEAQLERELAAALARAAAAERRCDRLAAALRDARDAAAGALEE